MQKIIKNKILVFLCLLACFMGCLTLPACGTENDDKGDEPA